MEENKWIDENKYDVIDIALTNDIPILSYNGEGIIIDFLNSLNTETGLFFNKIKKSLQTNHL